MDNFQKNLETILSHNDGNHVNGDAPERFEEPLEERCGCCGEPKEDVEKETCDACSNDEYIKKYTSGKKL